MELNFEEEKKNSYNKDPDLIKEDLNDVLSEIPNRKSLSKINLTFKIL